jgi:hypothetical protein
MPIVFYRLLCIVWRFICLGQVFEWVFVVGQFLPLLLLVCLVLVWFLFVFYVYIVVVSIIIFSLLWF